MNIVKSVRWVWGCFPGCHSWVWEVTRDLLLIGFEFRSNTLFYLPVYPEDDSSDDGVASHDE